MRNSYSLTIDESTAVDCTKMIFSALRTRLLKDKLALENLIGIGVDRANVIMFQHCLAKTIYPGPRCY